MSDKLVLKKPIPRQAGKWEVVRVKGETYTKLDMLARELDRPKSDLVTQLLEYAMDRIEIKEGE